MGPGGPRWRSTMLRSLLGPLFLLWGSGRTFRAKDRTPARRPVSRFVNLAYKDLMFTRKTLSFLRALSATTGASGSSHAGRCETHVRAPIVALVERLAIDLRTFAPELIGEPKTSLFRIYRDTRFSSDKTPYKTHVARGFRCAVCRGVKAPDYTSRSRRDGCGWAAGMSPWRPRGFTIFARRLPPRTRAACTRWSRHRPSNAPSASSSAID